MGWPQKALYQTITYWAPSTPDGYGGKAYSSPTSIKGRWEDTVELFIDAIGREKVSMARVYVDRQLVNGGFIFLGTNSSTDPTSVDGAREIRQVRKIPDLRAKSFEHRVML